jgi:ubiquinone/menaquinone biosynthesis C-methylase UbiE
MKLQPPIQALPFDLDIGTEEYYYDPTIYDHDFKWYKKDKNFYLNMGNSIGGDILEFGCGTGRLMVPWVKSDLNVCGVDISDNMLIKATEKLKKTGKKRQNLYSLVNGDMKSINIKKKFNLIVSAFNTMMHLYTLDDMTIFLKNVRKHLDKNGTFIFDILNPDFRWLLRDPQKRWAKTRFKHPHYKTWYYYTTNHFYDAQSQISYVYIYHEPVKDEDGPSYMLRLAHRMYFPQEMETILHYCGFKIEASFGDFDSTEIDLYSPSQIYICT